MRLIAPVVCLVSATAFAHDQWIEVQTSATGVTGRLFLSDGTSVEELPRNPERLARFELITGDDLATFAADAGAKPSGVAPPAPFLAAIYESKPATLEQTPSKFAAYLKEDSVVAPPGLSLKGRTKPVTERYSRCLVAVPRESGPVGCEFELELRSLDPLLVVAHKSGRPVKGQVVWLKDRAGKALAKATTAADGTASFGHARGHRVTAILMTKGEDTDVRSFWAATTLP
ncbi:MAG: hypothetical protein Q8L14_39335 [Myxococcales bacterium]|nr:hypothetical protein [Myxococcales bacterium]